MIEDSDMLRLWDSGFNTSEIAARFGIPEYEADRRVRRARERRRNEEREYVACRN